MAQSASYSNPEQSVSGVVRSVNPKGVKLEGREDWLNFSKFAEDIAPPERGQLVTLTLDKAGFIRAVDATGGPSAARSATAAPAGARDRTITRLAVLKAAAEFGASRQDLKSGDVLKIAESWEKWILHDEPDLEALGLTAAF